MEEIEYGPVAKGLRTILGFTAQYGAGIVVTQIIANNVVVEPTYKKAAVVIAGMAISAGLGVAARHQILASFDSTVRQLKDLNVQINAAVNVKR